MDKKDGRYRPARLFKAVETEALKQTVIQGILTDTLEEMAPTALKDAMAMEEAQKAEIRKALEPLAESETNGSASAALPEAPIIVPNLYGLPEVAIEGAAEAMEKAVFEVVSKVKGGAPYGEKVAVGNSLAKLAAKKLLEGG
jgi:hypothetical protein